MRILRWRLMETPPDDGGGGDGGAGGDDAGGGEDRAAVEATAKDQGWTPRDQWRGNPNNWVDAPEYVERNKTFVPFLQHERKKLKTEIGSRDQEIAALRAQVAEANTSLKAITTFNEEMARDRAARRKVELGNELKAAREAGDDVRVAELTNELGEVVKTKPPVQQQPPDRQQQPPQPPIQPWVQNFLGANETFFNDPRKVALFNVEVLERRKNGDARVGEADGTAFLTEAREAVERMLGGTGTRQRAPSKTDDSRPPNGGGGAPRGAGGKTYADLPADARAQCDKQEEKFVDKDKPGKFKTQADWRRHFVSEYFGPSTAAMSRMSAEG